jgi:hypothetical protein
VPAGDLSGAERHCILDFCVQTVAHRQETLTGDGEEDFEFHAGAVAEGIRFTLGTRHEGSAGDSCNDGGKEGEEVEEVIFHIFFTGPYK